MPYGVVVTRIQSLWIDLYTLNQIVCMINTQQNQYQSKAKDYLKTHINKCTYVTKCTAYKVTSNGFML